MTKENAGKTRHEKNSVLFLALRNEGTDPRTAPWFKRAVSQIVSKEVGTWVLQLLWNWCLSATYMSVDVDSPPDLKLQMESLSLRKRLRHFSAGPFYQNKLCLQSKVTHTTACLSHLVR